MTDAQAATYHRQYLRWHSQQERAAKRVVLARLRFVLSRIISTLEKTNIQGALDTLPLLVTESDHQQLLERIYIVVGVAAAERQYSALVPPVKASLPFLLTKDRDTPRLPSLPNKPDMIRIDHKSEVWRQRMVSLARNSETVKRIAQITEKTRSLVRGVLVEAAGNGWALPKIVKGLREVLLSKTRATLIARTETTRAANVGHEIGAETTVLILNKVWIATADSRTRPDHAAMLGSKPISRDAYFNIGGIPMRYPGDPNGGAANTCNCRCVVSYIPVTNPYNL